MAPLSDKLYWTVVAALYVVTAASIVMLLWPLPKPIVEVAKPAVVQPDGSTVIERTDTQPSVRPPHVVPKGAKVERVVQVKAVAVPQQRHNIAVERTCRIHAFTYHYFPSRQSAHLQRYAPSSPSAAVRP